jgi:hypothetical protein
MAGRSTAWVLRIRERERPRRLAEVAERLKAAVW